MKKHVNPFEGRSFGALTHVIGAISRHEYDFEKEHPDIPDGPRFVVMDLTEVLLDLMDTHYSRDHDMCDFIRSCIGRVQNAVDP